MAQILIVDDEPDFLLIVEETLRLGGHDPVVCGNPQMAKALLAKGSFDAAILDVNMPGLSGFELVAQLRQEAHTASLPIMLLSAHAEAKYRVRGLKLGADDYLAKPFDPDELLLRVGRLTGSDLEPATTAGLAGDLATYNCGDLLRSLEQTRRSGTLSFEVDRQPARILLQQGEVVEAMYGVLRGEEACYGLLQLGGGGFRLREQAPQADATRRESLKPTELLLRFHWMEDELARRRAHLPRPSQRLQVLSRDKIGELEPDLLNLPLAAVLATVEIEGLSCSEICQIAPVAPLTAELAVAVLMACSAIGIEQDLEADDRQADRSLHALELAIHKLVLAAGRQRPQGRARALLLATTEGWHDLLRLVAATPPAIRGEDWNEFRQRLMLRGGGSCLLRAQDEEIRLHVLELSPETIGQAQWLLPACTGALLWARAGEQDLIAPLTDALASAWRATSGILVAGDEGLRTWLADHEPAGNEQPWRVLSRAPRDLATALGLLQ